MLKDDCLFCKIAKKEIPAKVVFEDDRTLIFEDRNPQAPVHLLAIPKTHVAKVSDLTQGDLHLVGELVLKAKEAAKGLGIQDSGFRIVINCNKDAGQEVFHLHLHILGGRKMGWPPG